MLSPLVALLLLGSVVCTVARADFGFHDAGVAFLDEGDLPAAPAGGHPFTWTAHFGLNTIPDPEIGQIADGDIRDLRIQLPPGLVGTPTLPARCSRAAFLNKVCPLDSAIGVIDAETSATEGTNVVYNLIPLPGAPAEFGFITASVPFTIRIGLNPEPPHNLVASISAIDQGAAIFGVTLTLHGVPGGAPLLTLPRRCGDSLPVTFEADSWQHPGTWAAPATAVALDDSLPPRPLGIDDCGALDFAPSVAARSTGGAPGAPAGLDIAVDAPVDGLTSAGGVADADIRRATLTFPEGMGVNASVAVGLGGCSPVDFGRETANSHPGDGCPDASRIGTATVASPLLEEPVAGSVFVAQPDDSATAAPGAENPFDSLLALYVVFKDPRLGILIKQPVEVEADPATGRLKALVDEMPELPFSRLELRLRAGPRSPLRTPPGCGEQTIHYELTPSSGNPPRTGEARFGGGQECRPPAFEPSLTAGATSPVAGSPSSFLFDLELREGDEELSRAAVTLPPGLSANFAAVALCPEALAPAGTCPASSRIGSARIAVGAAAAPLLIPQAGARSSDVFLAGPYAGSPFSLIAVVPARAGPFDLGAVVARAAIEIDPRTAQATVRLDPLPQVLSGIPLTYRKLRIELDRPGFLFNPTSCEPALVRSEITSIAGRVASPSARFRVGRCGRLGFRPRLSMTLLGPTHRGAHPAVRVVLATRPGDAGIRRGAVTLPRTELLDSTRIRAVCTRVQFAAERCPAGSRVGRAKAWTPLLNSPLEGPVYLRAGGHQLPDLVAALDGQIQLEVVDRIDSVRGRIRNTFESMPDARFSRFALNLRGGRRGLLANTGGFCARQLRVSARFAAHNGRTHGLRPIVRTDCGSGRHGGS